jgi:hypothetical protein
MDIFRDGNKIKFINTAFITVLIMRYEFSKNKKKAPSPIFFKFVNLVLCRGFYDPAASKHVWQVFEVFFMLLTQNVSTNIVQ